MARYTSPRLITPQQEAEEVSPYLPVWPGVARQFGVLFVVTVGLFVAFGLLGFTLPSLLVPVLNLGLALLPVILWLIFSLWPERAALEPRRRLVTAAAVTALAANALALPFITGILQPERWLPLANAVNRIVGYSFSVGIVQELTKYGVLRFSLWPDYFRTREDGIAYGLASALGYATVLNLQFILTNPVAPHIAAIEIFNNLATNAAGSILVGYGIAETRLSTPSPFLLTLSLALGSLINGALIPLRTGLTNADLVFNPDFRLNISAPSPIFSVGLSAAALFGVAFVIAFLFNTAERREREAIASREV